jgi:GUN4-like
MYRFLISAVAIALSLAAFVYLHANSLTVDFVKLKFLLSQKKWIEADLYTEEIVRRIVMQSIDNETFFGFSSLDFLGFSKTRYLRSKGISCEQLKLIDELWTKSSDGKFGLTVQARTALSMRKSMTSLSGEKIFTWNIVELGEKLKWFDLREPYLKVPEWYEPANRPEDSVGFLPSERWVLKNAGGAKPTYTYSDALNHFIKCTGMK